MNIDLLTRNANIKDYIVWYILVLSMIPVLAWVTLRHIFIFAVMPYSWKSALVTQPANIGHQDVPKTSPSNVPRTSPKDPIWPSWGHPDLTSPGRPNIASWGRPEMMSRGCPNLTLKGLPWEVDSRRPQDVLRTSLRGSSEYSNLDVPVFFVTFLSELIRLTKSI